MEHYVVYEFLGNEHYEPFKSYIFCKVADEYYDGFKLSRDGFDYIYQCVKEAIASKYNIDKPSSILSSEIIILYHEECGCGL